MLDISITLLVSNLLKSNFSVSIQPENILDISVTLLVLNLLKSIFLNPDGSCPKPESTANISLKDLSLFIVFMKLSPNEILLKSFSTLVSPICSPSIPSNIPVLKVICELSISKFTYKFSTGVLLKSI